MQFLNDLGHRITSVSADDKEAQFLFQRLSIALQRFNAILLHESFESDVDAINNILSTVNGMITANAFLKAKLITTSP